MALLLDARRRPTHTKRGRQRHFSRPPSFHQRPTRRVCRVQSRLFFRCCKRVRFLEVISPVFFLNMRHVLPAHRLHKLQKVKRERHYTQQNYRHLREPLHDMSTPLPKCILDRTLSFIQGTITIVRMYILFSWFFCKTRTKQERRGSLSVYVFIP